MAKLFQGALKTTSDPKDKTMTHYTQTLTTRRSASRFLADVFGSILKKIAETDRRHREINKLMRTSPEHLRDMGIDPAKITNLYRM